MPFDAFDGLSDNDRLIAFTLFLRSTHLFLLRRDVWICQTPVIAMIQTYRKGAFAALSDHWCVGPSPTLEPNNVI